MKKGLTFLLSLLLCSTLQAQSEKEQEKTRIIENRIELIAENLEAEELDFSTLFDELSSFFDNPINLNSAKREDLARLYLLSDFQINNLLYHIKKTGKIISIYELQGVEGFDLETIYRIQPFIHVSDKLTQAHYSLQEVFEKGKSEWFFRHIRILEEQLGFSPIEEALLAENPNRRYLGSADRWYSRYRFRYSDKISFGVTAEKDAGEEFFQGTQSQGFDYYSAHLFFRDLGLGGLGKIQKLVVGDYQMQFGQGLTLWSGLAFGKSSEVLNIKRNGGGIKPYTSVDENVFLRGAATTLQFGKLEWTPFFSSKKIDANLSETDPFGDRTETVVSSLQTSGFHRTPSEVFDKDGIRENHFGSRLAWKTPVLDLGLTFVQSEFGGRLERNLSTYNQFDFNSNKNNVAGFDANYIFRNFNFFGEFSRSKNGAIGYSTGLIAALDPKLDFSLLHRSYDKDFQSLLGNGVSESSRNQNETGTYLGLIGRPVKKVTLSIYYDQFRFPWLRFLVNAPSSGAEFLVQGDYKPSKKTAFYIRFREENKGRNSRADVDDIQTVERQTRQYLRFQFSHKVSSAIHLKTRAEFSRYHLQGEPEENGSLLYQDVVFKPKSKPYSFAFRYALFDTDSYNSRIYAYENDVLYFFTVPAYYNRGNRTYLTLKYRITRKIDAWFRVSQTYYTNIDEIGSGLTLIDGNTRTEIKTQVRLRF